MSNTAWVEHLSMPNSGTKHCSQKLDLKDLPGLKTFSLFCVGVNHKDKKLLRKYDSWDLLQGPVS